MQKNDSQSDVTCFGILDESMHQRIHGNAKKNLCNFSTQTPKKNYRSKEIQCKYKHFTKDVKVGISVIEVVDNYTQMSPKKEETSKKSSLSSAISSILSSKKSNISSDYQPSSDDLIDQEEQENKRFALAMINYFIDKEPNFYVRIPSDWLWIINKMSNCLNIPTDSIKLTLIKIKLDDQFQRLGHQFGYCRSNAARIFKITVPKIAELLKTLIYVLSKKQVRLLLPIPFRLNFSKVFAIIDCFEIQIEVPSNALHQSLTWSEYKKCNIIKYLLCITPDGLVIFVSEGF